MKFIKGILVLMLSLYTIGCIGLYNFQEKIIFNPDKIEDSYVFSQGEEVEIEVEPGIYLNAIHIKKNQSKGVVIYFHGNRGDNRRCLRQANSFMPDDYDLLMTDYRGYGKSDGEIDNEEDFFNDAQAVYDFAKKSYTEDQIVIAGYSLGTSVASYLAAHNRPAQLVLAAPFASITYIKNKRAWMIPDFLLKYPFDNLSNLKKAVCPIQVFHGTKDDVVDYENSLLLKEEIENLSLVTLPDVDHRRIIFSDQLVRWFDAL